MFDVFVTMSNVVCSFWDLIWRPGYSMEDGTKERFLKPIAMKHDKNSSFWITIFGEFNCKGKCKIKCLTICDKMMFFFLSTLYSNVYGD